MIRKNLCDFHENARADQARVGLEWRTGFATVVAVAPAVKGSRTDTDEVLLLLWLAAIDSAATVPREDTSDTPRGGLGS